MKRSTSNSLHMARKYAQIFARRLKLFRGAKTFPRAKLLASKKQIMSKYEYLRIFLKSNGSY